MLCVVNKKLKSFDYNYSEKFNCKNTNCPEKTVSRFAGFETLSVTLLLFFTSNIPMFFKQTEW